MRLLALFLLVIPSIALAHEAPSGWTYPLYCCSNQDCRPIPDASVKEGKDGYSLPSGEVLPYSDSRIRHSPDGLYHWCSADGENTGKTICLFVPPKSF